MDVVRTSDGRAIGGTYWTILLKSRPGIYRFQLVQETLESVKINYVPDAKASKIDFDHFRRKIRENCGSELRVEFVQVDRIDLTGSGKQRLILSNVKRGKLGMRKAEEPG